MNSHIQFNLDDFPDSPYAPVVTAPNSIVPITAAWWPARLNHLPPSDAVDLSLNGGFQTSLFNSLFKEHRSEK